MELYVIFLCSIKSLYFLFFYFCMTAGHLHVGNLHLLTRKPNNSFFIYSNKFFHNFHLFESSFTCPRLQVSGLVRRLHWNLINQLRHVKWTNHFCQFYDTHLLTLATYLSMLNGVTISGKVMFCAIDLGTPT